MRIFDWLLNIAGDIVGFVGDVLGFLFGWLPFV